VVGWNVMSNGAASLNNYYPSFDQTYSQLKAYIKVRDCGLAGPVRTKHCARCDACMQRLDY